MRAFLDTSVLVAVFYGDHQHHDASMALFRDLNRGTGCCGAHSLAEVYSTLTRMPGDYRVSGEQALLFIGDLRARLMVVALTADEYAEAIGAFAAAGVTGGATYDALLAHCALKADAAAIYSWNRKHYALCGPEVERRLRTPGAV